MIQGRILFLLGLMFSTVASAGYLPTQQNECTRVDLREAFPMKIRDQGEISWCYAHAAADLLQFTYRIPTQISAADIAIGYADTDVSKILTFFRRIFSQAERQQPPETGFIRRAVRSALKTGWCPESVLPSDAWIRVDQKNGLRQSQPILAAILEAYDLQKKIRSGKIKSASDLPAYYEFKGLGKDGFFELARGTRKSGFLSALRREVCSSERVPFPETSANLQFSLRSRSTFQKINESLNSGEPHSIDFFSGIFENYDHYRRRVSDLHTVLMVGRRFNSSTGQCEYLMKNSYGEGCSQYDPKIPCEGGYLWFPERNLFPTITSHFKMSRR